MSCRIVCAKPEDLEIWPNTKFSFLLNQGQDFVIFSIGFFDLRTSSLVTWSVDVMFSNLRQNFISKPCVLFSSSAVKIHDSHAYRNMDMTRERISFTFDSRDILLSLHTGFRFVRAAKACAILERTFGFELLSKTIATWYLKLVTVQSFCPVTLISR